MQSSALRDRQPPAVHRLPQRLPLEQLGHEIGGALERADVVDCEDVGVREAGDGKRLLLEPPQPVGIVPESRRRAP